LKKKSKSVETKEKTTTPSHQDNNTITSFRNVRATLL